MPYHIDPALKEWATEVQGRYIDAVNEYGSAGKAAPFLNCNRGTITMAIRAVRKKAALSGYSPDHDMRKPVPPGFTVKGVSTYYDSDGKPRGQWVKSRADDDAREQIIREAFGHMAAELPRLHPLPQPPETLGHLCNLFTLTDSHVGMLAWGKEGGADWDLKIAEHVLVSAFEHMVAAAPRSRVAIVNQLGDFLHFDSIEAVTPTNRHLLDADGRFSKVVAVALRILRRVIDVALMTHDEVHVIMAEGNHDITSSVWLRQMFKALYENEPRVTVNDSELPYYVYQHGKVLLAFHHGHLKKNESLPLLFAAQYPKLWGDTVTRYVHVGHRHHVEEKEHSGMKVIQHPTLAARDAYAARGGWQSMRQATAITYHSKHGEVSRHVVTPDMLSSAEVE